jgi:hypothetical protein
MSAGNASGGIRYPISNPIHSFSEAQAFPLPFGGVARFEVPGSNPSDSNRKNAMPFRSCGQSRSTGGKM